MITIKKETLIKLWNTLESLSNEKQPVKFSYFIAKNKSKMKDEIDILTELSKPSEAFRAYDMKRVDLAAKLADKDKNDNPIVQNNMYVVKKRKEEFENEVEKLQKEHKEALDENEKRTEEFKTILESDIDFDGYKISLDNFPETIEPSTIELFMSVELISEKD